jgi:hypothetical protein
VSTDNQKFTTVVLGEGGSGKTVFMASTYVDLITSYAQTGFHFRAEQTADDQLLRKNYYSLERSDSPWPEGTQRMKTYSFELIGYAGGKTMRVQPIEYLDFNGEWLIDGDQHNSKAPREFHDAIGRAGLTIFIIDGKRIADLSDAGNTSRISELLVKYCGIISTLRNGSSIQFLISKYDYVEQKTHMEKIKSTLNKYPAWKNIIATCRDKQIETRLVPVSSVGSGAFKWDGGKFVRIPGTPIHPQNLAVPFAFGYLQMLNEKIGNRRKEAADVQKQKTDQNLFVSLIDEVVKRYRDLIIYLPHPLRDKAEIIGPIIEKILNHTVLKNAAERERIFEEIKKNDLQRLDEEERHYIQMVMSMKKLTDEFDSKYPECKLA